MADGQTAGMCIFWKEFCTLGVMQQNGVRSIELNNNGTSKFAWSLDGENFTPIVDNFKFGWGNYRGTRLGIYSYNNDAESGFIDVDFFHYIYADPQNKKWKVFASTQN